MSVQDSDNRLFPLFADLRGRRVLVVGGGEVALRKAGTLLDAGADLLIVAPQFDRGFAVLQGSVELRCQRWQADCLDGAWLAIAATDDEIVNQAVAVAAEARRILCNVVDRSELCSFQVPALVRRGPLLVAISSGGTAPVLARQLRARIELLLDDSLGQLATLLGRWRERIRLVWPDVPARRAFLETLDEGEVGQLLRQGRNAEAEQQLASQLAAGSTASTPRGGRVSLVGAGPGDAGLLTLKGHRRLHEADVILYDQLVSADVLALARRDAEMIAVGKQAGGHRVEQSRINALMVEHAAAGRRVVRLKGGDGFIFGRGGEELEHLRAAGIDYEVVPGITAALACAAYSGVPLTHRDHARSLQLVTAHCRDSLDGLDYRALARQQQTLAVYMGVAGLARLRRQLLRHGRAADTPFVLVENGSRPQQRVVAGRLDEVDSLAALHDVRSPALLILGEVAALAPTLHWFGAPLLGRPEQQAAA